MIGNSIAAGMFAYQYYGGGGALIPLSGDFHVIGHNRSSGFSSAVDEGVLPAVAPIYNIDTGLVESIYQRRRIYDPDLVAERDTFYTCAIDRTFAINVDGSKYIAITPYNIDGGIKLYDDWVAEDTLEVNSDITLMDCGDDYSPIDIVMLAQGKFIIVNKLQTPDLTSIILPVVTFTSPTSHTVTEIVIDLASFGFMGVFNSGEYPRIAMDVVTGQYSAVFSTYGSDTFCKLWVVFNPDDTINGGSTGSLGDNFSTGLIAIDQSSPPAVELTAFEFQGSDMYYSSCEISFGLVRIIGNFDYGSNLPYTTNSGREVSYASTDAVTYLSESSTVNITVAPLICDKLTALGYTPTSPLYQPPFGGISAFLT